MQELSPEAELAWRSLWRHLERSARFTLVFLSSAYPPALEEVGRRLEAGLRSSVSWLEVLTLPAAPAEWVVPLEAALESDEAAAQRRAPLWLALDRQPGDAAMNQLRDAVLAALNQQRTRLERSFQRPLLIAVPRAYLPRVWEVAPDLWTIRGMVADLPVPAAAGSPQARSIRGVVADPPVPAAAGSLQARSIDLDLKRSGDPDELSAVAEWRRLAARASADPESVSPFVAHAAVEAAIENGALSTASEIAEAALTLARARVTTDSSHDRQRALSVALDDLGRVALEQRRLEEAEQAFCESLAVSRRMLHAVGEGPTTLRDLSVSLDNVGEVALAQGRLEEAGQVFGESLAVRRGLLQAVGESATALRDLSVSLEMVGEVAFEQERLEEAKQAFEESLAMSRRLLQVEGESPTALRDLSVSLDNVGRVALEQGRLEEAEQAFAESLAVRRRLLHSVGESATALRDLSVSLDNVGQAAREQGKLEEAEQVFTESLAVSRRLLWAAGESATALQDLSVSLDNVGQVARERGRLEEAEQAFAESLAVSRRYQEKYGEAMPPQTPDGEPEA